MWGTKNSQLKAHFNCKVCLVSYLFSYIMNSYVDMAVLSPAAQNVTSTVFHSHSEASGKNPLPQSTTNNNNILQ